MLDPNPGPGPEHNGAHCNLAAPLSAQVRIHASSLNAGAEGPDDADAECTAVIFEEVTRNEAFMYIASSTLVRPHFLPLVAAHVQHHEEPVRTVFLAPCYLCTSVPHENVLRK